MPIDFNKEIIAELIKERNRLIHEIQELQMELNIVQKMIDKKARSNIQELSGQPKLFNSAVKPIRAILKILKENPDRNFLALELRDELEYLRKQGLLITDANNLLFTIHSTLRNLFNRGLILKVQEEGDSTVRYTINKYK